MPLDLNLGAAFNAGVNVSLLPWKVGSLPVVQDDSGLIKSADTFSPLDKQATVKITNTKINNVYSTLAKGAIPLQNQAVNTSGQSLFIELNANASKVVGTATVIVPMVARIELRLPNDGDMTNADIQQLLLAALATAYTSAGVSRYLEMMRGVLPPAKV